MHQPIVEIINGAVEQTHGPYKLYVEVGGL